MDKQQFLKALRSGLNGLPQEDIEERMCFYEEMINDGPVTILLEAE